MARRITATPRDAEGATAVRQGGRHLALHGALLAAESAGVLVAILGLARGPELFGAGVGIFVASELAFAAFVP